MPRQNISGNPRKLLIIPSVISFIVQISLIFAQQGYAATGDILSQNCAHGNCVGEGEKTGWTRSVVTDGCLSGECLRLVATHNEGSGLWGAGNTSILAVGVQGQTELTVVYSLKFDKNRREISGLNTKAFRPYIGKTPGSYYFATIAGANTVTSQDFQMNHQRGTLRPTSIFIPLDRDQTYPSDTRYTVPNGDGTWDVPNGELRGKFIIGDQDGFGTQWTRVRHWIKLPTGDDSGDGESKMWINGELAFHFYDIDKRAGTENMFTHFTWYPASEAREPFEHWLDEMVIYEGYVPPGDEPPPPPQVEPPTQLHISNQHE